MAEWREDLSEWLAPLLALLGDKARRRICPIYVGGLTAPLERKRRRRPWRSAWRRATINQLHHFIADAIWDETPLETELAKRADALVGGANAVLVVDDAALPKKGARSVGVAPQYASALGKTANCQTLVSLVLARREVPVVLGCAYSCQRVGRAIGRDWSLAACMRGFAGRAANLRSLWRRSTA